MNIDKQIEFDKVKEIWANLAITDYAKEKISEKVFYFSESELRKQLKDTTDARVMIEKIGTPPLQNITEIKDILTIAEKGACLTPYQLERVEKVLVVIKRLKDYLARGKMYQNSLAYYDENLDEIPELCDEIRAKIRSGFVDDYATKELEQIRKKIVECEEQMKQKAEQILRSNKAYMADNFCTFRNGRICIPVKKEYKQKIAGSVIDKSSTGSTLFIEPASVARYYEKLQLLRIEEENEVYRILYVLSALVLASAPTLYENLKMIEKLDYIFAKGKLSIDMDAVEPVINTERRVSMVDARHPLMDQVVAVPLKFDIGEDVRGIVITGPNTGGKTVAIRAAYGEMAVETYLFSKSESNIEKKSGARITKAKNEKKKAELHTKYKIGDSVMTLPEKKIGIVCVPINEKGVLRVQLPDKKIWINHKRVKLHVAAKELYPEDYDFSIVFDTVENRKKRHDMQRKYTNEVIEVEE